MQNSCYSFYYIIIFYRVAKSLENSDSLHDHSQSNKPLRIKDETVEKAFICISILQVTILDQI